MANEVSRTCLADGSLTHTSLHPTFLNTLSLAFNQVEYDHYAMADHLVLFISTTFQTAHESTPRPSAPLTGSAFTTPGLSSSPSPASSTMTNRTAYSPRTPTNSLLAQRRRTHSAHPLKAHASTPQDGAWQDDQEQALDPLALDEGIPSEYRQRMSQIYLDTRSPLPSGDEIDWLLVSEADNQFARRRRQTEGDAILAPFDEHDEDENDSCGK